MSEGKIKILLEKYRDHPSILAKIEEFIENTLPKQIQSFMEREKRQETLTAYMESYINTFFSDPTTQFYYIATSNIFIHYTCGHYKIITEDEVWHTILSDISSKKVLMDWKYKVKTKIVKLIREQNIFHAIPESTTIQHILNFLTATFFNTKEQAKYFLTCMGDSILKKNLGFIHFIDPKYKSFISNIQDCCYFLFNNTITPIESFKYRYHEHTYSTCRFLYFDRAPSFDQYWHQFLKSYILDIIIVSCHYSNRFLNSDHYITHYCHDIAVQDYTLYLKDKTETQVAQEFLTSYIITQDGNNNLNISWNNMYFLWKQYLMTKHYPNFIFKETLKVILMNKLSFDTKKSAFINVSSIHLKYVRFFTEFCDSTISDASNGNFEIGELCSIYKDWLKIHHSRERYLQEHKMIALLQYFYPKYIITEQKYINNISCSLWDKKQDIQESIAYIKKNGGAVGSQSFYQMYKLYCDTVKKIPHAYTVSKKYFESVIRIIIPSTYVLGDTIIESYWKS